MPPRCWHRFHSESLLGRHHKPRRRASAHRPRESQRFASHVLGARRPPSTGSPTPLGESQPGAYAQAKAASGNHPGLLAHRYPSAPLNAHLARIGREMPGCRRNQPLILRRADGCAFISMALRPIDPTPAPGGKKSPNPEHTDGGANGERGDDQHGVHPEEGSRRAVAEGAIVIPDGKPEPRPNAPGPNPDPNQKPRPPPRNSHKPSMPAPSLLPRLLQLQ
jgi:hypothetical protein